MAEQKKPRILWVSSDPKIIYSFSQQSEVICAELAKRGYDVHYIADTYRGKPYVYRGFKVYPVPIILPGNHYGNISVYNEYIQRLKPDIMISFTNTWQLSFLLEKGAEFTKKIPWIQWTPAESETPYFSLIKDEKRIPYYVCISKSSMQGIKPYQKNVIANIYHAVNDQEFQPLTAEQKKKLRKKYGIPEKAFVVGTVSSTAIRKQPFRLIDAFLKFAANKKNVYLVWYSDFDIHRRNARQFMNIRYILKYFYPGWGKKIKLIHSDKPLPEKKLNEIYNLFDVFALASAGEGFGIPLAEAMLCKVPPIATAYSSIPEIILPGCGWQVKVKDLVWGLLGPLDVQGALIDIDDLRRKFEEAYADPGKVKKYGEQAYRSARDRFTIGTIVDQWETVINKVFKQSVKKYPLLWLQGQPNSRQAAHSFLEIKKWLCFAYIKQEKWDAVLLVTKEENEISLLNARAYALHKLAQYREAKKCYEQMLLINPRDEKVIVNLNNTLQMMEQEMKETFTKTYDKKIWRSGSGTGSTYEATAPYRKYLQDFLRLKNIKSVLDLGCGDWEFSKTIDWNGIQYTGVDVVESVLAEDIKLYARNNIKFILTDFYKQRNELPPAELLLIKDVFQHWPNEYIFAFLPVLSKYRYVLITNCVWPTKLLNGDIVLGGFRPVDLTQKPFSLGLKEVLAYNYHVIIERKDCTKRKKVFLLENTNV